MELSPEQLLQNWLQQRRSGPCHRQLLVISGSEEWACRQAKQLIEQQDSQQKDKLQVLWLGEGDSNIALDNFIQATANQYRQFLGQEFDLVVYNCFSGFRANAVMALSGVVKSASLMLLLTPALQHWAKYQDPLQTKRTSFGYDTQQQHSQFVNLFVSKLQQNQTVARFSPSSFYAQPAMRQVAPPSCSPPYKSDEQRQAVAAICKVVTGHRQRPLLLTADRGRGKSSALGIAVALLLKQRKMTILLTAPTPAAVAQVFHHAQANLPSAQRHGNSLQHANGKLCFVAADELLLHPSEGHLLLVDEAAAIPAPMLCQLTLNYNRVVFSSTVHGYEGSGRGFEFRFKPFLQQHRPQWRSLHMSAPIRWYQGDSLEAFYFDAMLMHDDKSATTALTAKETWRFGHLSRDQLVAQPALLHQVFQLLVNAHYQTMPDDLLRMLDGQDMHTFAVFCGHSLCAVILCSQEGGTRLSALGADIACGKRRVQGHLVAQGLAYAYAQPCLAELTYLRIVRIAVKPQYNRQGIGHWALQQLEAYAKQQGYDVLTTSYGITPELLAFWRHSHFVPAKLGLKKDASSGEHSVIMYRSLSLNGQRQLDAIGPAFAADIRYHASTELNHIDSVSLWQLYHSGFAEIPPLSDTTRLKLIQFAGEDRPMGSCMQALQQLALCAYSRDELSLQAIGLLFALAVQRQSFTTLNQHYQLKGKKQLESKARDACRELLQYL